MLKKYLSACGVALVLVACGGEEITYYTEYYNSQVVTKVESGNKLKECTPEKFGEMAFLEDSSAVFFCNDNAWIRMTFAYEKDTVVIKDSSVVFAADSNCTFVMMGEDRNALICAEDTLWFGAPKTPENSSSVVENDVLTDNRDGSKYRIVTIGSQMWMAENLNFSDSVAAPQLKGSSWCYDGDKKMCDKYGRLYTFDAAKNICPSGWRLPSEDDWKTLLNGIQDEKDLKDWKAVVPYLISAEDWSYVDADGIFGFSAYPAGTKKYNGDSFYGLGDETNFWNEDGSCLMIKSNSLIIESHDKNYGFSVRCVKIHD